MKRKEIIRLIKALKENEVRDIEEYKSISSQARTQGDVERAAKFGVWEHSAKHCRNILHAIIQEIEKS